jgi:hemerythrin-like metal-binding protein
VDDLAAHASRQFLVEEQLLRDHRVEFADRHLAEHQALASELRALGSRAEEAEGVVLPDLMELMRSWLVDHVLKTDRAMVAHLRARGVTAAA